MTPSAWDRRIERAERLATTCTSAAGILQFYVAIARLQKAMDSELRSKQKQRPEISMLLPHVAALLTLVSRIGPAPLARAADELLGDRTQWEALLAGQPDSHPDEGRQFFARSLLQPYTEYLAGEKNIAMAAAQPACPFCDQKPQVGVLRGEGDGAKRSLVCSLCSTEWAFRRILCPNCGEEGERNLPIYTAEEFPHVRVEACDSCGTYIKSVDLTRNGLAVPIVDELATISLNLWAEQHGYTKLQLNLLGM